MFAYVATKNAGKLRELREIFSGFDFSLETYAGYGDVEEGELSYEANAALKAHSLRALLVSHGISASVLGDDSGLEAFALGGRPGVLSARYGGPDATWAQRRHALLAEVDAAGSDRGARFVCALHLIDAAGREFATRGEVYGTIAERERGAAGFSYDAIFEVPSSGVTFAELAPAEKNRISHRAKAASALLAALRAAPAAEPEPASPGGNQARTGM